ALQVAHHETALLLARRCEREAAVAHRDGGDAVPARRRAELVPEQLRVHVGVPVDESGRDDVTLGVELLRAGASDLPDGVDPAVLPRDVALRPRRSRAVDPRAVANHQVVAHAFPSGSGPGATRRPGRRPWCHVAGTQSTNGRSPGPEAPTAVHTRRTDPTEHYPPPTLHPDTPRPPLN